MNDLKMGGRFNIRMESRDGKIGFEFEGTYDKVEPNKQIFYTIAGGRKVTVTFTPEGKGTKVVETFEAENTHSIEMQRSGWQAILNNFKSYTENRAGDK